MCNNDNEPIYSILFDGNILDLDNKRHSKTRSSLYKETDPFYLEFKYFETAISILSEIEAMHMMKKDHLLYGISLSKIN